MGHNAHLHCIVCNVRADAGPFTGCFGYFQASTFAAYLRDEALLLSTPLVRERVISSY